MLHGRSTQQAELAALLDAAEAETGAALVLRGTVGVGRTALLDWTAERAEQRGFRVLRVHGVQGESGLAYGGLSQLLLPLRDRIDALVPTQAAAVRSILDAEQAPEGDAFVYGLAALGLLASASEERPVLCVVDDAHWVDLGTLDALLFAARRLTVDAVAMVFVFDRDYPPVPGLRELTVAELPDPQAERLLDSYELPRPERVRVLAEAEGNPLALHELAAAGARFGDVAGPLPISETVAAVFDERLARLDEPTRLAVLVAAAEGHGKLPIVLAAAHELGVEPARLAAAERAGLVRIAGDRVVFDHPLVRNACYRSAPLATRSAVHRALAEASNEPSCCGYHLWSAATGPDETTAARLWVAGEHAAGRRAYADAATQFEWSAKLTPDADQQGSRMLHAASTAVRAGQIEQAGELADRADALLSGAGERIELARIQALVEVERDRPDRAAILLLRAVEPLSTDQPLGPPSDPVHGIEPAEATRTVDEMLTDAATLAWEAGSASQVRRADELAIEAGRPNDVTQALTALAQADGDRGLPQLAAVLRKATEADEPPDSRPGPPVRALTWGVLLGDAQRTHQLASRMVARAREGGLLRGLPDALVAQAQAELWFGHPDEAATAVSEAVTIRRDTCMWRRTAGADEVRAQLAAIAGDEHELRDAVERWTARSRDAADAAVNLLDSARRRYPEVVRRVSAWLSDPGEIGGPVPSAFGLVSLADGVEAAIRTDQPRLAETWLELLREWADANALPWARGVLARAEALSSDDEPAYSSAIDRLIAGERPLERARGELLYGEWLRRNRRRSDARKPLSDALATFRWLRAHPWIERTHEELRATGESLVADRDLAERPADRLTPRERQVVRLAAGESSSEQIAAQLFLSRRTVEHHLYRAYRKLGVGSRRELSRLEL